MKEVDGRYIFRIPCPDGIEGCNTCHYGNIEVDAYNIIHDCFVSVNEYVPDNHTVYKIYTNVPKEIKDLANMWDWDDTEVRDKVFVWLSNGSFI